MNGILATDVSIGIIIGHEWWVDITSIVFQNLCPNLFGRLAIRHLVRLTLVTRHPATGVCVSRNAFVECLWVLHRMDD
jgi:hypothetical protein